MLGWNLLQIHNHQVLSAFFQGIRQTLGRGVSEFEQARRQFQLSYEPEFPQGTGERPRARGYHFKSEAGQAKINKTTWVDLNSASSLPADTSVANGSDSPAQVDDGIETPLKPDGDAQTLAEKGFAERDSR
jgi:queuine tRNA-ribosyltransferase